MSDMIKCPYCGAPNAPGRTVCFNCKRNMETSQPPQTPVTPEVPYSPTPTIQTNIANNHIPGKRAETVFMLVVVLIALSVMIYRIIDSLESQRELAESTERWEQLNGDSSVDSNSVSQSHKIKYEVTGTVETVLVTYSNSDGGTSQIDAAQVPWSKSFTSADEYAVFSIVAQNQQAYGSVTVNIYCDGRLLKTTTSERAYVVASANASTDDM